MCVNLSKINSLKIKFLEDGTKNMNKNLNIISQAHYVIWIKSRMSRGEGHIKGVLLWFLHCTVKASVRSKGNLNTPCYAHIIES